MMNAQRHFARLCVRKMQTLGAPLQAIPHSE